MGYKFAVLLCAVAVFGCAGLAWGKPAPDKLGQIDFPTSCRNEAQPDLEKGLALLHSFQYTESEKTFAEAVKLDKKCAIGYWGEAMARYYQLWEFPSEKSLKQGRKEMERAKKPLRPGNAREQALVNAGAEFFQKKKMSHVERETAYSTALERAHQQAMGDVELSAFYALSLLTLAEEDVDDMANREKAIAVLQPLLNQYPNHPGIAHYLIHAADKPELAAHGLEAARRYASIAPDSSHALHMPSHIFVRLGLWQDSITSNIAAKEAGARAAEKHTAEAHYQMHAMDFLSYSYLQSGQEHQAREVIGQTEHVVGANEKQKTADHGYLAARTAIELHRWKEAAELPIPDVSRDRQDSTLWAKAIGAARNGDAKSAQTATAQLREIAAEREKSMKEQGYKVSGEKAVDLGEAESWVLFAQGKSEEALKELRAAADRQDKEGGESVHVPAREMLADMLMELKRPREAAAEYALALKHAPNRFDGLLGAAHAAQANGDAGSAQTYYAKLLEVCASGADRPEIAEAKTVLAKK